MRFYKIQTKYLILQAKQNFSQTDRNKNMLKESKVNEIEERKYKLQQNKVFEGMNSKNTDELKKHKEEHFYPIQHPKNINFSDTNIISYKPPVQNLTDYNRIAPQMLEFQNPPFESPLQSKSLDIGILGPPNSGKSSLMNKLIGKNISAVSSKYNTTDDRIEGIYTNINEKIQLIYYDTPGAIKRNQSYISRKIITKAWDVIIDCDKLLFVVDSVKHLDLITKEAVKRLLNHKFRPSLVKSLNRIKTLGLENVTIEELLKISKENEIGDSEYTKTKELDNANYESKNLSTVLVMNKIDLVENKRKLRSLQEELEDLGAFDKIFHVSCETDFGIETLKDYLESESLRRPWRYHPDVLTTQTEVEKAEQVLKRIIYNRFYKEIPYNTIGYVKSWVPMSNGQIKINYNIEVVHDVQISMIIGKNSRVIKELREELDKELAVLFQMPVKCNLFLIKRKKVQQEILNEKGILNI